MLSQVFTDYLKNNHIDLDHHDVINVQKITFEGNTNDGNITTLKCDPTVDRLIQFPDANITVNKSEDLSGTTLSSNVINSSLQNLGSQNADLDMNGKNINNVDTINSSGTLTLDCYNDNIVCNKQLNCLGGILIPSMISEEGAIISGSDINLFEYGNENGLRYRINGNDVLSYDTIGATVVNSSLEK